MGATVAAVSFLTSAIVAFLPVTLDSVPIVTPRFVAPPGSRELLTNPPSKISVNFNALSKLSCAMASSSQRLSVQ